MMTIPATHHTHDLSLSSVPGVMKRGEHVMILLMDEQGRLVLGRKNLYPPQIYRMLGGGVEENENPIEAAVRELEEETSIKLQTSDLDHLFSSTSSITSPEGSYTFVSHVFRATVDSHKLKPSSELSEIVFLTYPEYQELIERYRQLPTTIDPELGFSWADYGKLYGLLHDLAWQEYQARHPSAGPVNK